MKYKNINRVSKDIKEQEKCHQTRSFYGLSTAFTRGEPDYGLEGIVLQNIYSLMDRFIRPNMGFWFTYPMVCTQIIDLFIPTSGPNVFTDEFNGIKGFGKHGSIPTQPVIAQPLVNENQGGIRERYRPFRKIGPDMHTDSLQPLPNRLFILIDQRFPPCSTSRPRDKTGN
jgi:hypothetical protein